MTRRFWLAGLAGALAMFVWMSFAHMTPTIAGAGMQKIPNEPTVLAALENGLGPRRGLFVYPYIPPREMASASARLASSPSGLLIYRPPGAKPLERRQMIVEFILELFESLVAVALVSASGTSGFARQVGFFAGLGFIAAIATNGSYWLWYGFPAAYSVTAMLTEFVKFVIAGVAVAIVFARVPLRRSSIVGGD